MIIWNRPYPPAPIANGTKKTKKKFAFFPKSEFTYNSGKENYHGKIFWLEYYNVVYEYHSITKWTNIKVVRYIDQIASDLVK